MTTPRNHLLSPWNHFKCLLDALKPGARVALVAGGYTVSAVVAVLVVGFLEWAQGPGSAPGGGTMKAVVQFFVFLGVFGLGAVLPTMAGLYFLRPYPKFWQRCSFVALGFSGLGLAGTITVVLMDRFVPSAVIFPVLVGAAGLAGAFALCACFAPSRGPRIGLASAAGLEIAFIAGWISFVARVPQLMVVNRTPTELTNIVASGTGFRVLVGTLPVAQQKQVGVRPSGESGLQLEFDADGKHHITVPNAYLEGSSYYHIKVTVAQDYTVSVTTLD